MTPEFLIKLSIRLEALGKMSEEIFSRFVRFGYKYKICSFQLCLKKPKKRIATWKLVLGKSTNSYILVNAIDCFIQFLAISNMPVQVIRDIGRPFHLGIDLAFFVIFLFNACSHFLSLSNSGMIQFTNNFFQFIPRAR